MSTLSKVFVILNLVLSITFAVFVSYFYKHAQNWRAFYNELKVASDTTIKQKNLDIVDRDQVILGLTNKNAALRTEISARNGEISALNQEKNALQIEIQGQAATIKTLNNNAEKQTNLLASMKNDARQLQDKVNELQKQAEVAIREKDQALDTYHENELKLKDLNNILQACNESIHRLELENNSHQLIFNEMRRKGIPIDLGATPTITGNVTGLNRGVVMISVGSDDRVKEGYVFAIARGEHFICNIRIDKVWPDEASGVVLPDSLRPEANGQADIKVGDYVATHLQ